MESLKSTERLQSRLAIAKYCQKHHKTLEHPSGDGMASLWEWAEKLGRKYKASKAKKTSEQFAKDRVAILATLMNEARAWDLFTRSLLIYRTFEVSAEQHIPELWN